MRPAAVILMLAALVLLSGCCCKELREANHKMHLRVTLLECESLLYKVRTLRGKPAHNVDDFKDIDNDGDFTKDDPIEHDDMVKALQICRQKLHALENPPH